jgi:hypothetical protein
MIAFFCATSFFLSAIILSRIFIKKSDATAAMSISYSQLTTYHSLIYCDEINF